MMKKLFSRLILLTAAPVFLALTASCAIFDRDKSLYSPSMWPVIDQNRDNLKKLKTGMTKDEVRKIMGDPLADQVYATSDHWWYYTRTRWSDGRATRDECTPVVFGEDEKLAGWGVDYYKVNYSFVGWTDKAIIRILK